MARYPEVELDFSTLEASLDRFDSDKLEDSKHTRTWTGCNSNSWPLRFSIGFSYFSTEALKTSNTCLNLHEKSRSVTADFP